MITPVSLTYDESTQDLFILELRGKSCNSALIERPGHDHQGGRFCGSFIL